MSTTSAVVAGEGVASEAEAYEFLERLRWGDDGPSTCPHCGATKGAWYLKPKDPSGRKSKGGSSTRSHRRVWKCKETSCRRQFSVLTNTVMQGTKMPLRAWVGVMCDLCEREEGVSAREIAERWDVNVKSAWAMLTRIQQALAEPEVAGARLASNAPLWFEITAATLPVAPEGANDKLEEDVAVDVARALAPNDPPAAESVATVKPGAFSLRVQAPRRRQDAADSLKLRLRSSLAPAEPAAEEVPAPAIEEAPAVEPAAEEVPAPAPSPAEVAPTTSTARAASTPVDKPERLSAAEQVRIDVQRALAEAFSEPVRPVPIGDVPVAREPEEAPSEDQQHGDRVESEQLDLFEPLDDGQQST